MSKYNIGMEMVDFQSDDFHKELTKVFTMLKRKSKLETKDELVSVEFARVIKQFTKLTFVVSFDKLGPSVEIPRVNRNHALIPNYMRKYLPNATGGQIVKDAGGKAVGTVDLSSGKVGGVFADIEHTMHFPMQLIWGEFLTAGELAAIMLHEVGHIVTYYYYITTTMTTNQVLEGLAREVSRTDDEKELEVVLTDVRGALGLRDFDPREASRSKDKRTLELLVLTAVVEQHKSALGSNIYDINSWEMLADNYATRCGAGRDLVTGLSKLHASGNHISARSKAQYYFLEAAKLTLLAGSVAAVATVNPFGIIGGHIGFALFAAMFTADMEPETYDRAGVRTKRIRDQINIRLRDKNLSKDERERLTEDLAVVDKIASGINNNRQFLTVMGSFIYGTGLRERYRQEKAQQELESLAANDLFNIFPNGASK